VLGKVREKAHQAADLYSQRPDRLMSAGAQIGMFGERGQSISRAAGSLSCSGNVRAQAGRKGRRGVVAGGQAMTFHEYLSKAVQHDAQQAGDRDRLLRAARRAPITRPGRAGPAAPVRRWARLLFRRVPA
jgi:hypothetical protein